MATDDREISGRIDRHLREFEIRSDAWFDEFLRPYAWTAIGIGLPRHLQIARQCIQLLRSLTKARDRGYLDESQAARHDEILRRFRRFGPLIPREVVIPERLKAQLDLGEPEPDTD